MQTTEITRDLNALLRAAEGSGAASSPEGSFAEIMKQILSGNKSSTLFSSANGIDELPDISIDTESLDETIEQEEGILADEETERSGSPDEKQDQEADVTEAVEAELSAKSLEGEEAGNLNEQTDAPNQNAAANEANQLKKEAEQTIAQDKANADKEGNSKDQTQQLAKETQVSKDQNANRQFSSDNRSAEQDNTALEREQAAKKLNDSTSKRSERFVNEISDTKLRNDIERELRAEDLHKAASTEALAIDTAAQLKASANVSATSAAPVDPRANAAVQIDPQNLAAAIKPEKLSAELGAKSIGENSQSINFNKETRGAEVLNKLKERFPRFSENEVVEKIQKLVEQAAQNRNGSTMVIRLDPPELGKVRVRLTHRSDQLFARVIPESQEVEQVLRTRAQDLVNALANAGFKAENVHLSLGVEQTAAESNEFSQLLNRNFTQERNDEESAKDGAKRSHVADQQIGQQLGSDGAKSSIKETVGWIA